MYAGLLLAGLAAGALTHGNLAAFFGLVTLNVFLPALIFEAAWQLDSHVVREQAAPIVTLAVPGVVVTAGIVALVAHAAGLPWHGALLLGAILSATDPIAVTAIFRALAVPRALATIVESESLLNDAMAVVLFRAVLTGAAFGAFIGTGAGILVGLGAGLMGAYTLRRRVHAVAQIAATVIGAYAVYVLCDRFNWSGIFAVITFAMTLRERERHAIKLTVARSVSTFWARLSFAANCALFFLLGAAIDPGRMHLHWVLVLATIGAVLVARIVLAYGLLRFARLKTEWLNVIRMAGIRGALALALALATSHELQSHEAIAQATFAVAIVTTLIGALTFERRIGRMNLS